MNFFSAYGIGLLAFFCAILASLNAGFYLKSEGSRASSRGPASAAAEPIPMDFEIACDTKELQVERQLSMIRLRLPRCFKKQLPKIHNSSNGHMASIFSLRSSLVTDYVVLNEGDNQFEIVWPGKTVKLSVLRK